MFREDQVRFVAGRLTSHLARDARICGKCGPRSATASFIPNLIDITIGSLDKPQDVPPALHYWDSKRLPWMHMTDGLPRYPEFPPQE